MAAPVVVKLAPEIAPEAVTLEPETAPEAETAPEVATLSPQRRCRRQRQSERPAMRGALRWRAWRRRRREREERRRQRREGDGHHTHTHTAHRVECGARANAAAGA